MAFWVNSAVSGRYASFRPTYPPDLIATIAQHCGDTRRNLCVDVGCGTGQATALLASHFTAVRGYDPSPTQISSASGPPNVTFHVSGATDISDLAPGSIDCVTVAQALHWFDVATFGKMAHGWLRPGGVFCALTYPLCTVEANVEANALLAALHNMLHEGGHWPKQREHVDNDYRDLLPLLDDTFTGTTPRTRHAVRVSIPMTVGDLGNYLTTWSGVNQYREKQKGTKDGDVVRKLMERMRGVLPKGSDDNIVLGHEFVAHVYRKEV